MEKIEVLKINFHKRKEKRKSNGIFRNVGTV
jgi:hypothetical protein